MPAVKPLPVRRNARLKNYDYASNGYYFVTVCAYNNEPNIQKHQETVEKILHSLPEKIPGVKIDYTCLMPAHIHTIFIFNAVKKNLGEVIRIFKALVSKETGIKDFWQRNYYEHVIRSEGALLKIREYIQNNPLVQEIKFGQFYENGLTPIAGRINAAATGIS